MSGCWIVGVLLTCVHDLQEQDLGFVMLGDERLSSVQEIGSIKLKLSDGKIRVLIDVRLIPQLKRNLILLGILEEKGCIFITTKREIIPCEGKSDCS